MAILPNHYCWLGRRRERNYSMRKKRSKHESRQNWRHQLWIWWQFMTFLEFLCAVLAFDNQTAWKCTGECVCAPFLVSYMYLQNLLIPAVVFCNSLRIWRMQIQIQMRAINIVHLDTGKYKIYMLTITTNDENVKLGHKMLLRVPVLVLAARALIAMAQQQLSPQPHTITLLWHCHKSQ